MGSSQENQPKSLKKVNLYNSDHCSSRVEKNFMETVAHELNLKVKPLYQQGKKKGF